MDSFKLLKKQKLRIEKQYNSVREFKENLQIQRNSCYNLCCLMGKDI